MQQEAIAAVEGLADYLRENRKRLVIAADTHLTDIEQMAPMLRERYEKTPPYYQGRPIPAEWLPAEMAQAKVDMSLVWQNPALFDMEAMVNYMGGNFADLVIEACESVLARNTNN